MALGKVEGGVDELLDALLEAIGKKGIVVAPTFSYSGFKNEIYNPETSQSTVGSLGMEIAARGFRNNDPNFSHAAIGKGAEQFIAWNEEASIGEGSFYDRFIDANGKFLMLGVDYTALPIFMHMEAKLNLPYRYKKEFHGKILIKKKYFDVTYSHYVRDEKKMPNTDRSRIGKLIDSKKM